MNEPDVKSRTERMMLGVFYLQSKQFRQRQVVIHSSFNYRELSVIW